MVGPWGSIAYFAFFKAKAKKDESGDELRRTKAAYEAELERSKTAHEAELIVLKEKSVIEINQAIRLADISLPSLNKVKIKLFNSVK